MSRPPLQWRVGDRCSEPKGRIGRITKLEYGVAFIELEDGGELSEEADNLDLVPMPPDAPRTFGHGLCTSGKYRYDTRPAADRGQKAFHRKARVGLAVYRCDVCHGWHLGSRMNERRSR